MIGFGLWHFVAGGVHHLQRLLIAVSDLLLWWFHYLLRLRFGLVGGLRLTKRRFTCCIRLLVLLLALGWQMLGFGTRFVFVGITRILGRGSSHKLLDCDKNPYLAVGCTTPQPCSPAHSLSQPAPPPTPLSPDQVFYPTPPRSTKKPINTWSSHYLPAYSV